MMTIEDLDYATCVKAGEAVEQVLGHSDFVIVVRTPRGNNVISRFSKQEVARILATAAIREPMWVDIE